MRRRAVWFIAVLILATGASGVGVVYAKYLTRSHFVELQQVRSERNAADVEWGRLRLEEAALSTIVRVEAAARKDLKMHLPGVGEVRLIIGDSDGR